MTKTVIARDVAKVIPVIGAVTSGGLTLGPMALRLDDELRKIAFPV